MRRVFHRVQVIEVAKELIEPVDGGEELVKIAQMVLAELAGGVALRFERGSNRASLCGDPDFGAGLADRCHACANGQFAHDKVCPARCATRFRDRKSTRLNSSHGYISYAVFC